MGAEPGADRLSINQASIPAWSIPALAEACAARDIGWIGLWREPVAETGLAAASRSLRDAGVKVSSLCRGGFFPAPDAAARAERLDDNRRAIDEAAALGTNTLVLVVGGVVNHDLEASRAMVADGIAAIVPHARDAGVKLAIEPLHPMFAADRSVVVTLKQAREMAAALPAETVGIAVDVYHVWWDPDVGQEIAALDPERILGFHVNDWIVPLPDMLLGRGMMGDGFIDLRGLRRQIDQAGYDGPIEVEIFNQALRDLPPDEALDRIKARYLETC
ncbi:sugar phosphate isomerase/epimerase family protein [Fodinicurvata sp. EGI_FJ10296]|uniref:sugar phosphate isomerase/epimerase family protein n=1 Tax=Fodinicurvata sp. EGI_FJ10296 TaxID=3231908 RepID=UPI00345351A5